MEYGQDEEGKGADQHCGSNSALPNVVSDFIFVIVVPVLMESLASFFTLFGCHFGVGLTVSVTMSVTVASMAVGVAAVAVGVPMIVSVAMAMLYFGLRTSLWR